MSKAIITAETLSDLADAIREKGGTSAAMTPADMVAAVEAIQTGGGDLPALTGALNGGNAFGQILNAGLDFDTSGATAMNQIFMNFAGTTLDVSKLETGACTNLAQMFYNAANLQTINGVGNLNVSRATSFQGMFQNCTRLSSLNLSSWNTAAATTFGSMFYGCQSLASLTFNPDFTNVTDMASMFYGCTNLAIAIDWGGKTFPKITSLSNTFAQSGITSVNLRNATFTRLTSTSYMFQAAGGITSIDLTGITTGNINNMVQMFLGTTALVHADLTPLNMSYVTASNMNKMFGIENSNNVLALQDIHFPATMKYMNGAGAASTIGGNTRAASLANLDHIILDATTPPTLSGAYLFGQNVGSGNVPENFTAIYVPDASVTTYKAATNWSLYASYIKGVSELSA